MVSDKERRKELGDFLKIRWEWLFLKDFNLFIGLRRRVKGLCREEVF